MAIEATETLPLLATLPLHKVRGGASVRVVELRGGSAFRARVSSMGLRVGAELEILQSGRFWGPVLVSSGTARFAIGHGMAHRIMVTATNRAET